jgi:hypothetical protein
LSLGSFSNSGRSIFRLTYLVIDPAEELLVVVVVVDDDELFLLRELLGVAVEFEENVLFVVLLPLLFEGPAVAVAIAVTVGGAGGRSKGADVDWGYW